MHLPTLAPSLLFLHSLLPVVSAHSHIAYLIINNIHYNGYDPSPGRTTNLPNAVVWPNTAQDDGFVPPSNYTHPDIICHRDSSPAQAHAPVKAGDKIHIQWNGWPVSHRGPVMSYLASCTGLNTTDGCASVDKTALTWTKIDNSSPGFLNETGGVPGKWASDHLIASNNSWLVGIPHNLAPGPYVLRHEIIALHYANKKDGAQNYPNCVNLFVEPPAGKVVNVVANGGRGPVLTRTTLAPVMTGPAVVLAPGEGVKATKLYKSDDPGVSLDIYRTLTGYEIPGPTVAGWAEPVPVKSQKKVSEPLTTGTPVRVEGTRTVPFPVEKTAA
ncbi:endo-1,4-beta-glucanase [Rhypophila decipiens]|uniref:lytic cellulose monooxygenase (C4-dehydrogenating) n=1 Tax=Rhypophila decipiens TaxID=261697 RepID=A0AAN7B4N5_9PEZI|nr:endo-1,4-beta-glucanase [Rhypophila decipiens]